MDSPDMSVDSRSPSPLPGGDDEHDSRQQFSETLAGQCIASELLASEETMLSGEHDNRDETAAPPTLPTAAQIVRNRTMSAASETGVGAELVNVTVGPQHFDLLKLIGEGGFGKVLLVKNRLDEQLYAMKVISKKLLRKKNHVSYMKSERDILTAISCPFVVSLHFAFQTDTKLFLVMDYLGGGELFFHLRRRGLILETEAQFYFGEMVLAIEFLHSVNIIHRDLKPENVLLTSDGHICITDFGLAKEIGDTSKEDSRTLCGTSEYMAPEMISRSGYGRPVDWWSLGALFFEMLSGQPPFKAKTQKELDRKILIDKFSAPAFLTASAVSLLKGLLDKDPSKRLGASKPTRFQIGGVSLLKRHAFFSNLDWDMLASRRGVPPITLADGSSEGAANFHEGFTGQTLSPSLVLDVLSNDGGSVRSCSPVPASDADPYLDFGYTEPSFRVPKEKVAQFESTQEKRLARNAKKKQHLLKLEEKRVQKLAEDEKERQRLAHSRRVEAERNRLAKLKAHEKRAKVEEYTKLRNRYANELSLYRAQQELLSKHSAFLVGIAKKIKNLRKKLRDIEDLEKKIADQNISEKMLSAEQREKLARRQAIEDNIAELEDSDCGEEEVFAQNMLALLKVPAAASMAQHLCTSTSATDAASPLLGIHEVMARLGFPLFSEPGEPVASTDIDVVIATNEMERPRSLKYESDIILDSDTTKTVWGFEASNTRAIRGDLDSLKVTEKTKSPATNSEQQFDDDIWNVVQTTSKKKGGKRK